MALPKAVQQQVEEADRLVGQISSDEPGKTETGTNSQPSDPLQDPNQGGPQDPPKDSPAQDNSAVLEEQKSNQVLEETWERKYHVLQGKFDAEVPRLHQQVREMQTQMHQLIAEKSALEATKPAEIVSTSSLITDEDKEAFGPDLIDLIERATEAKVATLKSSEAQLKEEIKQLKGQLGSVEERQVVSDKDRFLVALSQQVPDWEILNVNQGFLTWLQDVDPVYGIPKHVALTNAYETGDVARVASIFKTYKQTLAPAAPQAKSNQQELQRQVAPTRTRSTSSPNDNMDKPVYSNGDIEKFYSDWRRGYYTDDEAASMEQQIHAAIAEGRVR